MPQQRKPEMGPESVHMHDGLEVLHQSDGPTVTGRVECNCEELERTTRQSRHLEEVT
jgi:hypothetical protein